MQEQRKEQRLPSYLGGRITTDRKLIAIDCIVRNTCGTGAKLALAHTMSLPDEFELHIPIRGSAYRVQARWRRYGEIGVEMAPLQANAAPIPLALARRIKQLEAENATLKRRIADLSE